MEEGKIATAWAQFGATKSINVYKNVLPWVTLLLAWGRGSISAPFGPASRLLVQLNVQEYGRR
jgi:hypothetical protein